MTNKKQVRYFLFINYISKYLLLYDKVGTKNFQFLGFCKKENYYKSL